MKIDGVEVSHLSDFDGKPVKNRLPVELKDRLFTKNQWLEQGYLVKEDVTGYEMHANMMGKKLFIYFLDNQVEKIDSKEQICATCIYRENRYCPVMGDYIKLDQRCSEWRD